MSCSGSKASNRARAAAVPTYEAIVNRPRILFLIPYFGAWPFWMPFFLQSCRANPDIDWLLFSDCPVLETLPPNVQVRSISYGDYCALAAERMGIAFAPSNPYKLCDIKPALGHIHEADLRGYDFWAFGDLDLVYGDLRAWLSDTRLQRYDVLTTHARRVAGHLCVLRNTPRYRELFMRMKQWQQRFSDPHHHAMDEGAFSRLFMWRKNFPKPLFKLVGLFNPLRRASLFIEAYTTPNGCIAWRDGTQQFPRRWYWRHGKISNDRDELHYPYFHFACWKRNEWRELVPQDGPALSAIAASGHWAVDTEGFHPGEA